MRRNGMGGGQEGEQEMNFDCTYDRIVFSSENPLK